MGLTERRFVALPHQTWSPLLDFKPGPPDALDDEFNSTTLDAKWTAVTGASGTVSLFETGEVQKYDLTTRLGWLLLQAGSAANQKVQLRQDLTLADGDSVILAVAPVVSSDTNTGIVDDERWTGIVLNDNDAGYESGEWNAIFMDTFTDAFNIIHYDGTTVHGAVQTTTNQGNAFPSGSLVYLRFSRVGSVLHAFVSTDGSTWMALGSDTRSATATNIWIFTESVVAGNDPVPIQAIYWIRQGNNSFDPW